MYFEVKKKQFWKKILINEVKLLFFSFDDL